jgi:hypothetical protein
MKKEESCKRQKILKQLISENVSKNGKLTITPEDSILYITIVPGLEEYTKSILYLSSSNKQEFAINFITFILNWLEKVNKFC